MINSEPKLFGRIGDTGILNSKIKEAKKVGATVKRDNQAKTVKVTFDGKVLFKALGMKHLSGTWLLMYNPEFYPM